MDKIEIERKLRLQLITQGQTEDEILREAEAFILGGGRWLQLRMKKTDTKTLCATGKKLAPLCRETGTVFIVNDRPEIALECGAAGVHLGKNDMDATEARRLLGPEAVIGRTANTWEDILEIASLPVNYIGLGPYRFTTTKENLSPVIGTEGYRDILGEIKTVGIDLPVTAIGGIRTEDIPELFAAGVRNFAVSGAIYTATDRTEATRNFLRTLLREETNAVNIYQNSQHRENN